VTADDATAQLEGTSETGAEEGTTEGDEGTTEEEAPEGEE
jgi:hypothetical protein